MKFRHYDKRLNECRYSDKHDGEFYVNLKGVLYMYAIPNTKDSSGELKYYKSYENDLFTGRKDLAGNDIYANDIVKHYVQSEFLEKEDWEIVEGVVRFINGVWCVEDEKYPLYGFENELLGNTYTR